MTNEDLDTVVDKVYKRITANGPAIRDIFIDYFGEDKVDYQPLCNKKELRTFIENAVLGEYILLSNCSTSEEVGALSKKMKDVPYYIFHHFYSALIIRISNRAIEYFYHYSYIYVYFPRVQVTNEYNKSTVIYKLFVRILLSSNSLLANKFSMVRSEYTLEQFNSRYTHSHCPRLDYDHINFVTPCTGTGPINNTMQSLMSNFNLDIWRLFCLELDKYVHVESISGVPYIRLETIGNNGGEDKFDQGKFNITNKVFLTNNTFTRMFTEFTKYFINLKVLKFSFINDCFSLGMPFKDYLLLVSNKFIEWYNKEYKKGNYTFNITNLVNYNVLCKCYCKNEVLYKFTSNTRVDVSEYIGTPILTFKGKQYNLEITDYKELVDNSVIYIMSINYASEIINEALKIINYKYGRENSTGIITGYI